jgi:D-alanyl-D-alanine carboxypeptidase
LPVTINLSDYSKTAAQRGWGAGWPACSGALGNLAIVTAARSGVRVSVHKRIARLVDLLFAETERRGYLLRSGQTGAYNCRAIAGTTSPSNHSWGLAIDINWQLNPFTSPRKTDMPAWMPVVWGHYGFAWGGNYTGKQDSMHYEFMGSPADADAMTALALRDFSGTVTTSAVIEDDMRIDIVKDAAGKTFRGTGVAQSGATKVRVASTWGGCSVKITALGVNGPIGDSGLKSVTNNRSLEWALPSGALAVTVEGSCDAGSLQAAGIV